MDSNGYCTRCQALVQAFEIHGTRYTSLENALAAAQDGDTITLRGPLEIENADAHRDQQKYYTELEWTHPEQIP